MLSCIEVDTQFLFDLEGGCLDGWIAELGKGCISSYRGLAGNKGIYIYIYKYIHIGLGLRVSREEGNILYMGGIGKYITLLPTNQQ